jgi:hypothetical protein
MIRGVAVVILLEDYCKALERNEAKGILPSNPYYAALNSVIYENVQIIKAIPGHNAVDFVHDDGSDVESLKSSFDKFKVENPKTAKMLGGFACLDDKKHPELQASDMVANYAMQLGLEALERKDGTLKTTLKEMKSNIMKIGYWDEGYILYALKTLLKHKGQPIPIDLQDKNYD